MTRSPSPVTLADRLVAEHITDTLAAGAASVRSARRVRAVTIRCETCIGPVTAEVVIDPVPGVGVSVLSVVTDDGDAWSLPEIAVQRDATRDVAKFVARLRQGITLGADAHEYPVPLGDGPCITGAGGGTPGAQPGIAYGGTSGVAHGDGTNHDSLDCDFADDAQED